MLRYDCNSKLHISYHANPGSEHCKEKTFRITIWLEHHKSHTPYYDVSLPPEAAALIRENLEWFSPHKIAKRVLPTYPVITAKQVHAAWTTMSETLWKRGREQLPSVKTLLGELEDDVTVLDVPKLEGVEQIAWVMKKVLLPLSGKIVEIGIDATCEWQPSSIRNEALTRQIDNTNSRHLELYSVIGEYDNVGFPLSYCLLTTASSVDDGKRTRGRIPAAPTTFNAKPGQRIRIRFINSGSDTSFRVALAGHSMTVTHTDGYPVVPRTVDALLIGMAERYDVIVTAADGVFPLVALAEGKNALARALLSTGKGSPPDPQFRPAELTKRVGTIDMFTATTPVYLGRPEPDLNLPVVLGGNMVQYNWMINGEPYSKTNPLHIRQGQRPTLTFDNTTMMYHPMHLHGHTFQLIKPDGTPGARKDTVIVLPKQKVRAVLVADNPGTWVMNCHNTYHDFAGMQTRLD